MGFRREPLAVAEGKTRGGEFSDGGGADVPGGLFARPCARRRCGGEISKDEPRGRGDKSYRNDCNKRAKRTGVDRLCAVSLMEAAANEVDVWRLLYLEWATSGDGITEEACGERLARR